MRIANLAATALFTALPFWAAAEGVRGKPVPGGTGLQTPATPVMEDLVWLDDFLLVIITLITLVVLGLIVYTVWRFREEKNPEPQSFTHNAKLEVAWTAIPVLILVIIAIPSLRLLFFQLDVPEPDLTVKATGYQWYWGYEYPEQGITMDAYMLEREELAENGYEPDEYLLATDTRIVVPVDANVHLLVTGGDVIHNWAMPAFGIKTDAIPGRINETWFRATEVGTYFGQCSELCGMYHAYMPIVVEVVSQEDFDDWISTEQARQGVTPATELAQAE